MFSKHKLFIHTSVSLISFIGVLFFLTGSARAQNTWICGEPVPPGETGSCHCVCDKGQCDPGYSGSFENPCPGTYCCATPPSPSKETVGGRIIDSQTSAPVAGIVVRIVDPGDSEIDFRTTDSNGNFEFKDEVDFGSPYAIRIESLVGSYVEAYTTNNTQSAQGSNGPNTPYGSASYENQIANASNDCDQACNFNAVRLDPPTIISVNVFCDDLGNGYPQPYAVFRWNQVTNAVGYNLRINVDDGTWGSPQDWWIGLPATNPSVSYSCSGGVCTAEVGINPSVKTMVVGNYSWSVQSRSANGGLNPPGTAGIPGANFSISATQCAPYSINGQLHEVSVNDSNQCTYIQPLNIFADIGGVDAKFEATGYSYEWDGSVNAGNSTYSLPNVPGDAGIVKIIPGTNIPHSNPELASQGVNYDIACVQAGDGVYVPQTNLAEITVSAGHGNLSGYNFGYTLDNPFDQGWFASLDGDTYGSTINAANIPNTESAGLEPFLTFANDNTQVAVFGNNLSVNRIVEGNKYINGFTGDFWPETFSFTPPLSSDSELGAEEITTFSEFQSMQIDRSYWVTNTDFNSILTSPGYTGQYNLGGSGVGVTTMYIIEGDDTSPVFFGEEFRSTSPDRKLLLVSQVPITIGADIGISPESQPSDLRNIQPHIDAAIISQRSITFESNYDPETPGQLDKIIILEGPFVAGTDENTTVNINLARNLGIYNAQYPAALVKYNNLYMNELTEVSGMLQSSITWKISP